MAGGSDDGAHEGRAAIALCCPRCMTRLVLPRLSMFDLYECTSCGYDFPELEGAVQDTSDARAEREKTRTE